MTADVKSSHAILPLSFIPQAPELITTFDEHRVSPNFKFGILYQKNRQVRHCAIIEMIEVWRHIITTPTQTTSISLQFTEEDILSNTEESEEFKELLSLLGETVRLQGFSG